jgi:hypothetical protein
MTFILTLDFTNITSDLRADDTEQKNHNPPDLHLDLTEIFLKNKN